MHMESIFIAEAAIQK